MNMTKEEKQLLLKDLCGRLPYGIIIYRLSDSSVHRFMCSNVIDNMDMLSHFLEYSENDDFKPYLRPMSSMTDEERKEYKSFIFTQHHEWDGHGTSTDYVETDDVERYFTWLNKKMFDYRGLIPMGLALEAPEDIYK